MAEMMLKEIIHPEYQYLSLRWRKWRLTYESGDFFIQNYLVRLKREPRKEWQERLAVTYCPAFAKEAVNEVKNAIFQRLTDVSRKDGTDPTYVDSCRGDKGGVDRQRATMTDFIGQRVLPEMLTMRRVGVWIDFPKIERAATAADVREARPYLYLYPVEAIRSWRHDDDDKLTRLLIQQTNQRIDEATGLPISGSVDAYRYAWIGDDGFVHVRVDTYEQDKNSASKTEKPIVGEEVILEGMKEIPFVQFQIQHSLLEDVCNHQVALLNMESADVYWCIKANRPIYTEMFDPLGDDRAGRPAQQVPVYRQPWAPGPQPDLTSDEPGTPVRAGQAKEASEGKDTERTIGTTTGVGYAKGLDRPGYIHPSSEPITAAMAKEKEIKEDIRRLVQLSVATLDPKMASAESKSLDNQALQNGLCTIGAALQKGENEISHHWSAYTKSKQVIVRYPEVWTMQSDNERRDDASALAKLKDTVPSKTCQKEILKQVADKLVGHKVPPELLDTIHREIESAECLTVSIEDLEKEIELRIVSAATASVNRGYPKNEHEKALKEQADQLAIIAISQSGAGGAGAARGVPGQTGDTASKDEKKLDASKTGVPQDNTRGPGQDKSAQ